MVKLIFNADDFGISKGVNEAIYRAHTQGVLKSASIMITLKYAQEALDLAKKMPNLNIGLHADLTNEKSILSKEEIERYLPNASERKTTSTVAAGGNGSWWTSTGIPSVISHTQYSGYAVSSSGSFMEVEGSMRLENVSEARKKADDQGVRPAIYVNESDLRTIISATMP